MNFVETTVNDSPTRKQKITGGIIVGYQARHNQQVHAR